MSHAIRSNSSFLFARATLITTRVLWSRRTLSTSSASAREINISSCEPGSKCRVGFAGTGIMGSSMAGHLFDKGYSDMLVYNRTKSKLEPMLKKGAREAESPEQLGKECDIVFCMLGYPEDVRSVILGDGHSGTKEGDQSNSAPAGIMSNMSKGKIVVDMTTSSPSLAEEMYKQGLELGVHCADAPVSGGDKGAKDGNLSIFVGAERKVFETIQQALGTMGTPYHVGKPSQGQSAKMGNQIVIASSMIGLCEGMVYAHRSGIDVKSFIESIRNGGAGSKSLELYAGRILDGDLDPGFFVKHFVKDLGIALEECQRMGISLPGLSLAVQLYNSLVAHGGENLGTQALIRVLENLNNTDISQVNSSTRPPYGISS